MRKKKRFVNVINKTKKKQTKKRKKKKKGRKKKGKKRKKKPIFNKEYCILYVVFIWIRLRRTICRGWIPQTPRIIVNTCYKLHLGYFEPTIPGLQNNIYLVLHNQNNHNQK